MSWHSEQLYLLSREFKVDLDVVASRRVRAIIDASSIEWYLDCLGTDLSCSLCVFRAVQLLLLSSSIEPRSNRRFGFDSIPPESSFWYSRPHPLVEFLTILVEEEDEDLEIADGVADRRCWSWRFRGGFTGPWCLSELSFENVASSPSTRVALCEGSVGCVDGLEYKSVSCWTGWEPFSWEFSGFVAVGNNIICGHVVVTWRLGTSVARSLRLLALPHPFLESIELQHHTIYEP